MSATETESGIGIVSATVTGIENGNAIETATGIEWVACAIGASTSVHRVKSIITILKRRCRSGRSRKSGWIKSGKWIEHAIWCNSQLRLCWINTENRTFFSSFLGCYRKNSIEIENIERKNGKEIEKNASHDPVSCSTTSTKFYWRIGTVFFSCSFYLFFQHIQSIPVHEPLEYDGQMTQIACRAIEGDMKVSNLIEFDWNPRLIRVVSNSKRKSISLSMQF